MKILNTHRSAADIVDTFDDFLEKKGIRVPSPDDDERTEDNSASLYGEDYSKLLDAVEDMLLEILDKRLHADVVTSYTFSDEVPSVKEESSGRMIFDIGDDIEFKVRGTVNSYTKDTRGDSYTVKLDASLTGSYIYIDTPGLIASGARRIDD